MGPLDIILLVFGILVVVGGGIYFLNRWATKRYGTQQEMMEKNKQAVSIFVIDKRHDKAANVNLPKVVMENLPRTARLMKMHFIKAQIKGPGGAQIATLICDKNHYGFIETKKTYNIELAGIYIAGVKGAKTKHEQKQAAKAKKAREKVKAKP